MTTHAPVCAWDAAAELGEGALWHAASQRVYFVDINGRRIHSCDAGGGARRTWQCPQKIGFILPMAGGDFLCGLQSGLFRFTPGSGAFESVREVEPECDGNRLNDGFIDQRGNLWFGTMDEREREPSGALYRFSPQGCLSQADTGYVISNGPAMSPDGATLYHTDTLARQVHAFDVLPSGALGGKRLFACFNADARPGYPDGMAVDAQGCVWIAFFGGGRVERRSAAGKLLATVDFPCDNVTKLAFGGADLRTVFVTTARKGLSAEQLSRQPLAGGLFTFLAEVPGLIQHDFRQEYSHA